MGKSSISSGSSSGHKDPRTFYLCMIFEVEVLVIYIYFLINSLKRVCLLIILSNCMTVRHSQVGNKVEESSLMFKCILNNSARLYFSTSSNGVYFVTASVDVERHARDFMEAAKKLQLYFIGLQREDQPTNAEQLRKVI